MPLPPKKGQQKIATLLSTVDEKLKYLINKKASMNCSKKASCRSCWRERSGLRQMDDWLTISIKSCNFVNNYVLQSHPP